jgi:hypothetical protein
MDRIKNQLRRWRFYLKHDFLSVENVVFFLAVVLCLMWTYQSIMAMSRNWSLSEKLVNGKKELELLKVETETASLENEYYKSQEYQEIFARKYLDKMGSNEKMVVLPENSEQAKRKHLVIDNNSEIAQKEYSNLQKWLNFLFPDF